MNSRFLFSIATAAVFVLYYVQREDVMVESDTKSLRKGGGRGGGGGGVKDARQHSPAQKPAPQSQKPQKSPEKNPVPTTKKDDDNAPVVDLLSTGSLNRLDLLQAQSETFGSHPAVRHFFQTTEHNDTEQECHQQLTTEDALNIAKFCRRVPRQAYYFLNVTQDIYMAINALEQKANPAGWVCAQKRPIDGLTKVLQDYQTSMELPDYLILTDDDTYVNLDRVLPHLQQEYPSDTALAVAGCLMHMRNVDFGFAFGGFGTVLTKAALERLVQPIHCQGANKKQDTFSQHACGRIQENNVGEAAVFKEGMSVADLMYATTFAQAFLEYASWEEDTPGFCMHSDTAIGYFINYYQIPILNRQHNADDDDDDDTPQVDEDRMHAYKDSEWPMFQHNPKSMAKHHECDNDHDEVCTVESHVCHYVTPARMRQVHQEAATGSSSTATNRT